MMPDGNMIADGPPVGSSRFNRLSDFHGHKLYGYSHNGWSVVSTGLFSDIPYIHDHTWVDSY